MKLVEMYVTLHVDNNAPQARIDAAEAAMESDPEILAHLQALGARAKTLSEHAGLPIINVEIEEP